MILFLLACQSSTEDNTVTEPPRIEQGQVRFVVARWSEGNDAQFAVADVVEQCVQSKAVISPFI